MYRWFVAYTWPSEGGQVWQFESDIISYGDINRQGDIDNILTLIEQRHSDRFGLAAPRIINFIKL